MPTKTIDHLIVNSPYVEPSRYWKFDPKTRLFDRVEGERRPAGYVRATEHSKAFDDPGVFIELPLANQIRKRVRAWREAGYPGVTGITQRLLAHWQDPEQRENRRLFFCQLEAIETLIWLTEVPPAERAGVVVPSDGGAFGRLCSKMATGSGKTIVMAMIVAWQVLNKVADPQSRRFGKNIFVVAPGLTVKNRLQVLKPGLPGNYYDTFNLIPLGLRDRLLQGNVLIRNWHALMPLDPNDGPRVVKKGPESDEAFCRRVLGDLGAARQIVVINDEAHHAWRVPPTAPLNGVSKDSLAEATQWVGGLDRIDRARGILTCFDLSATPFVPTGNANGEETLFKWIVSDFGLNDAIEAGLVKTPRVVVRDDSTLDTKTYKSRLYHIYNDKTVKDDLNRKAGPEEPLPDLVVNGYYLLGKDWLETAKAWAEHKVPTPPVMITVANRTETAARVANAFAKNKIKIDELSDPEFILHIDSKVLGEAEAREEAPTVEAAAEADGDDEAGDEAEGDEVAAEKKLSKKDQAEQLRLAVDTVGQVGKPGERVQCVISVGMLSEGWDAKTVTHIMGLRAFTSQLLCEQVVGRGLRRTSYEVNPETKLFEPEYVNVFGVPFTFLPHEADDGVVPPPPKPQVPVQPESAKARYALSWPNVIRIDHEYRPKLSLDTAHLTPLVLDAYDTATHAEIAAVIEGKPDVAHLTEIDLAELARKFRMQKIVFETARDVFDQMKPGWKGSREYLLAQIIRLVEQFIASDGVRVNPPLFNQSDERRRIILTLNMNRLVQHIWEAIRFDNTLSLQPVFDSERPIRATGDMRTWYTSKPCSPTDRSHISPCVFDSTWEASEAFELDRNSAVDSWVKNDHLGFEVLYTFDGVVRKYRPDFLVRLRNGRALVLEVKGQDSQENKTKREFLDEWVRAVNAHGGFGEWTWDVSRNPADLPAILDRHNASA